MLVVDNEFRGGWKVQIKEGGETQIVDPDGRQRFHGADHEMTANHFAMLLMEHPLESSESSKNCDAALRMAAERFLSS